MKPAFEYDLPSSKIAQQPTAAGEQRADARLLHLSTTGEQSLIRDRFFRELPSILRPGDLLVLNNSRVMHTRFFARLERTGAGVEVLLLGRLSTDEVESQRWSALAKPMRKLKAGDSLNLSPSLRAIVGERIDDGRRIVLDVFTNSADDIHAIIEREGLVPIPPYIRQGVSDDEDRKNYQNVFADTAGSVAAPTAGLHFTKALLDELRLKGVLHTFITLHVGAASFLPLELQGSEQSPVLSEDYLISNDALEIIERTRVQGGRIIAVGTTTTRALESFAREAEPEADVWYSSRLFIAEPFDFKYVNALITNFHQPGTTHMHLVSAIAGETPLAQAYHHALGGDYMFLSYGDGMFIEPVG
ncbi:MAG: tRNA preQ1(34) S-adenosylmethionine ribosyltransferase-isomerase QueA [bacterium]|nr:tRNA preQ1(34) S-adenosylmethionine ribosyltransferase-isomerase QueA [bacterium]